MIHAENTPPRFPVQLRSAGCGIRLKGYSCVFKIVIMMQLGNLLDKINMQVQQREGRDIIATVCLMSMCIYLFSLQPTMKHLQVNQNFLLSFLCEPR